MCKTDDKVKFFHNWQAWQKVIFRRADNLALSAADHPPNFAPDILMIFRIMHRGINFTRGHFFKKKGLLITVFESVESLPILTHLNTYPSFRKNENMNGRLHGIDY